MIWEKTRHSNVKITLVEEGEKLKRFGLEGDVTKDMDGREWL